LRYCKKPKYLRNKENKVSKKQRKQVRFYIDPDESKLMNKDKECLCGSFKRGEQCWCDECHENFSKCKTSTERVEYFLKKISDKTN